MTSPWASLLTSLTSLTSAPVSPAGPAVVPIFVNAGAALIPAVVAPVASALALLFKPRELVAACRRRPLVPVVVVLAVAASWALIAWVARAAPARAGAGTGRAESSAAVSRTDWAAVALKIIDQGGLEKLTRPAGPATPLPASPTVVRFNYARGGYDGGPVPLDLRPQWDYAPPKDEAESLFLSSPAVVKGRVYAASCLPEMATSYGSVVCLSAGDGRLIWKTDAMIGREGAEDFKEDFKGFFSSPALTGDGKYLVIGQGLHTDKDSSLVCLDAATGKLHWRVKTPLHVESSPAIFGDLAVAGAGAIEGDDHKPVGDAGFVLAVRVSDGQVLWRHPLPDPESTPAIGDDGTVYIGSGFNGNAVVALRSESDEALKSKNLGRELWKTPAPLPVTGDVTLAGELVLVGGGNGDYVKPDPNPQGVVLALDRKTGAARWSVKFPDAVLGSIAVRGQQVVCPCGNGEVVALNLGDGKELWRRRLDAEARVLGGAALAGDHVYAVSSDGYLHVLGAADGKPLGKKQKLNAEARPGSQNLCVSAPTVAGGRVYVGSETGGLRCFSGGKLAE